MRAGGARSAGRAGPGPRARRDRTRDAAGAAALAAAAAAVLLAGCGSANGVRVGSQDPSGSPAQPVCGDVVVTLDGGADGRDICLSVGSTLRLESLDGLQGIQKKGAALTEVSPGVYRGVRAGNAELSGFRHACPSAKPGTMACHAIAGWKVTVGVR